MTSSEEREYNLLPKDQWRAATAGFIREIVSADVVVFTGLIDATALAELRSQRAAQGLQKPSWTAMVIKAISVTLAAHPQLNRLLLGGFYRYRPVQLRDVHAIVAVERVRNGEDTVYAQVLRHSDRKSIAELTTELQDTNKLDEEDDPRLQLFMRIIKRLPGPISRWVLSSPRLSPGAWLKHRGGAFALTTVGKYGVDSVFVKWPWPLSFTFGEVKERPMVVNGEVVARNSFYFSLAWNRELSNGAPVARFFHDIVTTLNAAQLD